jgi:hypothetical protein
LLVSAFVSTGNNTFNATEAVSTSNARSGIAHPERRVGSAFAMKL